jgi:uncharacterized protein YbaP (TraB family)
MIAHALSPSLSSIAASSTASPPDEPSTTLDEVDVVGEQPGPGLWKVTKNGHVLWILGTLDHVPRRMTWHSRQVEAAIASSQELITSAPAVSAPMNPILMVRLYVQWRGLQKDPDHSRLRDWLPATLYARFETLKARYDPRDNRIEELRPPFTALRLYQRALETVGLTRDNEIAATVLTLAGRHRVRIDRPPVRVADPLGALKQVRAISPAQEVSCLATTVDRLEGDLPSMQRRARAWAIGDVPQLRALPYPNQLQACLDEMSAAPDVKQLLTAASQAWMGAAEAALDRDRVSFALRPIYDLLADDGPLAHFRAEGYRIDAPK